MRALRIVVVVVSLALIGGLSAGLLEPIKATGPQQATVTSDCRAPDRSASERIAQIISDDSAINDLRLDEALAQLRRARKLCRSGRFAAAENDYRAIERTIQSEATGSVKRHKP